jgi:hypothetical protein
MLRPLYAPLARGVGGVSEPPACSLGAKPPPVGAKKVLGRPGDFLERCGYNLALPHVACRHYRSAHPGFRVAASGPQTAVLKSSNPT